MASAYKIRLHQTSRIIVLRTFTGDIDIFYEIFWKQIYNQVPQNSPDIKIIVDLGANIGMASLYFSSRYPDAKIYGIEPDPQNFDLLLSNMAHEISHSRFVPVKAAVSGHTGMAYIDKAPKAYNTKISTLPVSQTRVKTISITDLLSEFDIANIDLLKIDIEGAEMEIFSGDVCFLERVTNIVMECHSSSIKQQCEIVLAAHGFSVRNDTVNTSLLWASKV